MQQDGLRKLYVDQLKDIYSAENQLVKALPKLAKAATSKDLRAAFEEHLEVTKGQVERLEGIFEAMDATPKGKKCHGMEGLIEEGNEVVKEFDDEVLDAALIAAAQRVEHYEIAAYGTVRAYAEILGDSEAVAALEESLEEEKEADEKLTELAESTINVKAAD